jgi:hypothetical protein
MRYARLAAQDGDYYKVRLQIELSPCSRLYSRGCGSFDRERTRPIEIKTREKDVSEIASGRSINDDRAPR